MKRFLRINPPPFSWSEDGLMANMPLVRPKSYNGPLTGAHWQRYTPETRQGRPVDTHARRPARIRSCGKEHGGADERTRAEKMENTIAC